MFVDTTIYGYVTDGAAYHPQCLPAGLHPEQDPDISALFNWNDTDSHGLSCDACSEYIFEPVPHHAFEDPRDHGTSYGQDRCWTCGEYEDDELHELAPVDAVAVFDPYEDRRGLANRQIPFDPDWAVPQA